MGLLEPSDMPRVAGTRVPEFLCLVLRDPAPPAGLECPNRPRFSWRALGDLGIVHAVCLTGQTIGYDSQPLRSSFCSPLQDLVGAVLGGDAYAEERNIRMAAADVPAHLRSGEGAVSTARGAAPVGQAQL
jgi:hypothetical protein